MFTETTLETPAAKEPMLEAPSHNAPMAPRAFKSAAPTMPVAEDFPPIARQQLEARHNQVNNIADQAQKKRKSLLERLASVGIGSKSVPVEQPREPVIVAEKAPTTAISAPTTEQNVQQGTPAGAGNIHQLQAEIDPALDDDELEIPAFLRRQAN